MAAGETDGRSAEAPSFLVPRLLRSAEVRCADGRVLRGRVFLPASAQSHPGAMRADEWMNDPAPFFPFLPDGEGTPIILNKQQIVVVTVPAAADRDDALDQVGVKVRRVHLECGAVRLQGEVLIDMPATSSRVLDLLNRPGAFLTLREGERHHLVRKSRITRVSERPDGPYAD
jgi:hypothetical protein